MENLIGTWEHVKEETTGVDEFVEANAVPSPAREMLKEKGGNMTIGRDGDQWFTETINGDRKDTLTFRIGEEGTYKAGPMETKIMSTWEDGKLLGTHTRNDRVIKTACYVSGDRLILESTASGATMVNKYKRLS